MFERLKGVNVCVTGEAKWTPGEVAASNPGGVVMFDRRTVYRVADGDSMAIRLRVRSPMYGIPYIGHRRGANV
jgi:hypothetical protein